MYYFRFVIMYITLSAASWRPEVQMKTFQEWLGETSEQGYVDFCEASLTRMLSMAKMPFAIITAYKSTSSDGSRRPKTENIQRNRELRTILNSKQMGVHQLIGHWRECTATNDKGEQIPYNECPQDKLIDTIERSYFVPRPQQMDQGEFEKMISDLGRMFEQNAVIVSDGDDVNLIFSDGEKSPIGKRAALGRISQAYSQHILKQNVPFIFEGFQQLDGNIARQGAAKVGLLLPPINEKTKRLSGRLIN
jgi:hypothetical protein